jgi:hypothetical protein
MPVPWAVNIGDTLGRFLGHCQACGKTQNKLFCLKLFWIDTEQAFRISPFYFPFKDLVWTFLEQSTKRVLLASTYECHFNMLVPTRLWSIAWMKKCKNCTFTWKITSTYDSNSSKTLFHNTPLKPQHMHTKYTNFKPSEIILFKGKTNFSHNFQSLHSTNS